MWLSAENITIVMIVLRACVPRWGIEDSSLGSQAQQGLLCCLRVGQARAKEPAIARPHENQPPTRHGGEQAHPPTPSRPPHIAKYHNAYTTAMLKFPSSPHLHAYSPILPRPMSQTFSTHAFAVGEQSTPCPARSCNSSISKCHNTPAARPVRPLPTTPSLLLVSTRYSSISGLHSIACMLAGA